MGWQAGPVHVLDDLEARGLLAHATDRAALRAALDDGPLTFYVGFDPTAPSLHLGNLVQLLTARRLQLAGHRPLILVGGATGLIGDPRDAGERVLSSKEVVAGWVQHIREQVQRYVDLGGEHPATMVNNLEWTAGLEAIDFLRDIGKHFPVNRMLGREVVRSPESRGSPIMPVAPPTRAYGVWPASCNRLAVTSCTRFPMCRLGAVGSKPT